MGRQRSIRIVAYVSADLALRFADLASRFRVSRSELYGLTLERGFADVAAYCERKDAALRAITGGDDAGSSSSSSSGGVGSALRGARVSSDPTPPLEALQAYAVAVLDGDMAVDAEIFRRMLVVHAGVLGLSTRQSAPVVDTLVARQFGGSGDGSSPSATWDAPAPVVDPDDFELD